MSSNIFLVSDWHFGHTNCWQKFKRADGTPLRPFTSTDEMDETMIERHNAIVKPEDKVYCLGDVVINKKFIGIIQKLNGHKRLVRGNHDIFDTKLYTNVGFEEVYGVRVFDDMILSHIPLHRGSITSRFNCNVHGHLHANYVDDGAYLCVSVEHTDYAPLPIEEVRQRIKSKRECPLITNTSETIWAVAGDVDGVRYTRGVETLTEEKDLNL